MGFRTHILTPSQLDRKTSSFGPAWKTLIGLSLLTCPPPAPITVAREVKSPSLKAQIKAEGWRQPPGE